MEQHRRDQVQLAATLDKLQKNDNNIMELLNCEEANLRKLLVVYEMYIRFIPNRGQLLPHEPFFCRHFGGASMTLFNRNFLEPV